MAILLSVGLHLLAVLTVALLPYIKLPEAPPAEQGAVELLMVEQKGAEASAPSQPEQNDAESQPATASKADPAEDSKTPPLPLPPLPPTAQQAEEAVPRQSEQPAPARNEPQASEPVPPVAGNAPVFDLAGTDSESNAIALGDQIIPAQRDDRFRNRPPVFPIEAQMLGQHGAVVVVIHVAENGLANGVDLLKSSGVDSLDRAAIGAVRKWHFRPAMKDGHAVPFDMPFRVVFEVNGRVPR